MARETVETIRERLIEQKWIPRVICYRNAAYGSVDVVVYNVQGDRLHTGLPMARFEATPSRVGNRHHTEARVFETLDEALNHIGVYN